MKKFIHVNPNDVDDFLLPIDSIEWVHKTNDTEHEWNDKGARYEDIKTIYQITFETTHDSFTAKFDSKATRDIVYSELVRRLASLAVTQDWVIGYE